MALSSPEAGNRDIFRKRSDGRGEEEPVAATPRDEDVSDWSKDGNYILYDTDQGTETGWDLWYLERTEDGENWEAHEFLATPATDHLPMLSPDGRYIAYLSDESGQNEVYVDSFPIGHRRWAVSTKGGRAQRWNREGTELFYVEGEDSLVSVEVSTAGEFSVGSATPLFPHRSFSDSTYPSYDVSPDGRFLVAEPVGGENAEPLIRVTENWYAEFRDRQ